MTVEELIRRCDNVSANGECSIILQRQIYNRVLKQEFKTFNEFAIAAIEAELLGNNVTTFHIVNDTILIIVY